MRQHADRTSHEMPDVADPQHVSVLAGARVDLTEAIDTLRRERPEIAEAVVLRDIGGLDYAEIADPLGLPLGTVKSRITGGRSVLNAMLTRCGPARCSPAMSRWFGSSVVLCQTPAMPMRQFQHTVTDDDTAASVGSGDLDVLATPRLVQWCEVAAFQVAKQSIDPDHTTVGTTLTIDHVKGSPVGAQITVHCAEPINDGRRLVCHVSVTDADGERLASGEVHRAVVDPDRFMSKCHKTL